MGLLSTLADLWDITRPAKRQRTFGRIKIKIRIRMGEGCGKRCESHSPQCPYEWGLKSYGWPDKMAVVTNTIYPRSPRETMCGWVHLPRFIDKIRLHLAGRLPPEYQENFTRGFDEAWLKAAGVSADQFVDVVRNSITDGEVADWVLKNVRPSESKQAEFNQFVLNRGRDTDELRERLRMRKQEAGLAHRDEIQVMVDFIDADEGRL